MVYFAECLAATGMFDRSAHGCPRQYASHIAPTKRDVLGAPYVKTLPSPAATISPGEQRRRMLCARRGNRSMS